MRQNFPEAFPLSNFLLSFPIGSNIASPSAAVFFEFLDVPIFCNVLWKNQQAAQTCARGDIKLAFDPISGLIYNAAFDPSRLVYSSDYENALDFSPRFQAYARSLALQLIARHNLRNKDIIEIGCGKGDFLLLLCELGNNRGIGFDPSYVHREIPSHLEKQVQFIQDFYSEQYADYHSDFIVCRHTLEHFQIPVLLLQTIRKIIATHPQTTLFFEVPNGIDIFQRMAIWDIIYEHCCYFTPTSLSYLFSSCGFQVQHLFEDYQGQFLCLEATSGAATQVSPASHQQEVEQLASDLIAFKAKFQRKVADWQEKLHQISSNGKRCVVWGVGTKGTMFLNFLKLQNQIEYVVDINPRKHGMYVAGTGQQIVPPEFLQSYQPDVVLVMNPVYEAEIRQMICTLGLKAELMCVRF